MENLLKETSESSPKQENVTKYNMHISRKNTWTCNVWQWTNCNGNRPRPKKEQLEKIKIKNMKRIKLIPLKNCSFNCKYCENKIPGANKFIMGLNIDILQRVNSRKEKYEKKWRQNRNL